MTEYDLDPELACDFVTEALDLLSGVDNKLVELERNPSDLGILNEIFRGFHTIKGGAGFLNATALVGLCHLTENLFDKLRNSEIPLTTERMDTIMAATGVVRDMLNSVGSLVMPEPADPDLLAAVKAALEDVPVSVEASAPPVVAEAAPANCAPGAAGPDDAQWALYYAAVALAEAPASAEPVIDNPTPAPVQIVAAPKQEASGRRASAPAKAEATKDNSIRVDTARLDQVLNLSGEIGLTKNRLAALRSEILTMAQGLSTDTQQALDQTVNQLDLLVSDLQNAVMKTRMQPIGRLFQKYPRIARDLARQLGKDVDLVLVGEETEIDKTMIEDLSDPLIHLIRNAVDHGVESRDERRAANKPEKSEVRLEARQEGEHIIIQLTDDGRGMVPEKLRASAVKKGLLTEGDAAGLDDKASLNLIFLPGFSTAAAVSDVSGRGVGMDVVKTNIQKLNGSIDITSAPGKGTTFTISLPLTLAILPVLLVCLKEDDPVLGISAPGALQPFAVPLSLVREIIPVDLAGVQAVGGRRTMVVRGEVLPVLPLTEMLGWASPGSSTPAYGVMMQHGDVSYILGVDHFAGRDDAVIKSLAEFRPKGVSGVTTLANGQIVLILDMKELLEQVA